MTGGRTRSRLDLAIEALITTTSRGVTQDAFPSPEHQRIAALCTDVRSVAEVAVDLGVPIGVARVLVGDMAEQGYVKIHRVAEQGDRPDVELLEKVLRGLHNL